MDKIAFVLGKNVRELRRLKGWTQEYLAEKTGISVPFMTQIELAKKTPSLDVVENLAYALGVSYERLFVTPAMIENDSDYRMKELEEALVEALSTTIKKVLNTAK